MKLRPTYSDTAAQSHIFCSVVWESIRSDMYEVLSLWITETDIDNLFRFFCIHFFITDFCKKIICRNKWIINQACPLND